MLDIALNRRDGKLQLKRNSQGFLGFFMINGADRLAQKISMSLRMWYGEWFLDQSRGMPYLETIFVKGTRKSTIEQIIKDRILSVDGVDSITAFAMEIENRTRLLRVNFTCTTSQGPVKNSITLSANR